MKKTSISFAVFLAITIVALLTDYLVFFVKMPYILSLGISSLLLIIATIIKRKSIKKHVYFSFQKADILFFIILGVIFIANIASTPVEYDVSNYHIYLQENPFTDKINFDYFAGKSLNTFLFPLGDRIHYIARFVLGYRLGVIFSYLAMVCIYYQVKRLLSKTVRRKENHTLIPFAACFIAFSSRILDWWINSYYIDIFSVVFILEIIIHCLLVEKNNIISKKKVFYLFILTGLAGAIKITNLLLIIPILIFTKFAKKVKIKIGTLLIASLFIILPMLPYAIDNYIQTGSPLFPYYNKVFKSPYFAEDNFKDYRFNTSKIPLFIVWPVYTSVFNPRYGDNSGAYDPIWAVSYIAVLIILTIHVRSKHQKLNKEAVFIIELSLLTTFIWIFAVAGYMRYALVLPILYTSILMGRILEISNIKNIVTYSVLCVFAILAPSTNYTRRVLWRDFDKLLIDRNVKVHIDGVWGVIGDDSALTAMIREEGTPIYNIDILQHYNSETIAKKTRERIENKEFYVIIESEPKSYYFDKYHYLKFRGYSIVEEVRKYNSDELPYLTRGKDATLYRVKYTGDFPESPVYNAKDFYPLESIVYD